MSDPPMEYPNSSDIQRLEDENHKLRAELTAEKKRSDALASTDIAQAIAERDEAREVSRQFYLQVAMTAELRNVLREQYPWLEEPSE